MKIKFSRVWNEPTTVETSPFIVSCSSSFPISTGIADESQPIFAVACTRPPRGERQKIRHDLEGLNAAEKNEHDATIIGSCV